MTDYNNLIRRLRIYDCFSREAADALEAQVKRIEDLESDRTKLRTLLECKRDEVEKLRADAERYRWLRGMIFDDRIIVQPDRMLHGDDLDAAIDAAQGEK